MLDSEIEKAKKKDILSYLCSKGHQYTRQNGRYWLSSPFSSDSNWSFCVYPETNSFFDWSVGFGGDLIELVQKLYNYDFVQAVKHIVGTEFEEIEHPKDDFTKSSDFWKDFEYTKYLTDDKEEIEAITKYAQSRGIKNGYECGVFFTRSESGQWERHPSLMFLHRDPELSIIGAKFREINITKGRRFSCRGRQGLYILENFVDDSYEKPTLYLVESETSANSLWQFFKEQKKNAVVMSFGGVSSSPNIIPKKYSNLRRKLIIDFDGDEDLYHKRLQSHRHLLAQPIKLPLPKGEDLNSLYLEGKINLILNLI